MLCTALGAIALNLLKPSVQAVTSFFTGGPVPFLSLFSSPRGYWRQWADERFGDPPPKVDPGAFGGQGWKTPNFSFSLFYSAII